MYTYLYEKSRKKKSPHSVLSSSRCANVVEHLFTTLTKITSVRLCRQENTVLLIEQLYNILLVISRVFSSISFSNRFIHTSSSAHGAEQVTTHKKHSAWLWGECRLDQLVYRHDAICKRQTSSTLLIKVAADIFSFLKLCQGCNIVEVITNEGLNSFPGRCRWTHSFSNNGYPFHTMNIDASCSATTNAKAAEHPQRWKPVRISTLVGTLH